ncbi:hypothetical protein Z043_122976, partial [Scleropages formosus]
MECVLPPGYLAMSHLQDRTPSSSPDGGPHPLSFLTPGCGQTRQLGCSSGPEGPHFPFEEAVSSTSTMFQLWSNEVAHGPGLSAHQMTFSVPKVQFPGHVVLSHQPQIAAILQGSSKGLLGSTRRCRRCKCPNCQASSGNLEQGRKRIHICHIPECGK